MSKILKCLIIDDEEGAHLVLRHYIKNLKQLQLNIIGKTKCIKNNRYEFQ